MRGLKLAALLSLAVAACTQVEVVDSPEVTDLNALEMSAYVPTFSIAVDDSAFAEMSRLYLDDIEIEGVLDVHRGGEAVALGQKVELQVKGNFSAAFPSKSLGVKFDRAHRDGAAGLMRFPHVRDGHTLRRVKSFRLRNGGNSFENTLIKDLAYARMVAASDLDVVVLYGEPAATYVNGEFYSLHNLRTENNANGLSRLLDIDEDRLSLAAVSYDDPLEVKEGREAYWRTLEDRLAEGDAEAVLAAVDQSSFIDFIVGGSLFGVWDWPWRNVRLYAVDEGPVRFVLYDFDLAARLNTDNTMVEHMRAGPMSPIRRLFEVCYADAGFRERLEARYAEVRASGTLSPDRLRKELSAVAAVLDPVIAHQTKQYGFPTSTAQWYVDLEACVSDYTLRYTRLDERFE